MTPEQEADEFVLFQGFTRKKWNAAHGPLSMDWSSWFWRAEIAHAEKAELLAERDRLLERVRELAKARIREIVSRDADSSFPLGSRGWCSVACGERSGAWLMQLAEEAGCWFDDEGNEVPLAEWRERMGGVG